MPFQPSLIPFRWLVAPPEKVYETAMHEVADGHETPLRGVNDEPVGFGVGTTPQPAALAAGAIATAASRTATPASAARRRPACGVLRLIDRVGKELLLSGGIGVVGRVPAANRPPATVAGGAHGE